MQFVVRLKNDKCLDLLATLFFSHVFFITMQFIVRLKNNSISKSQMYEGARLFKF